MQQPKSISNYAKRNACFYMFIDEETEVYMKNSSGLDDTKRVGLWRVVVVRNLPYADARRNGKVHFVLYITINKSESHRAYLRVIYKERDQSNFVISLWYIH